MPATNSFFYGGSTPTEQESTDELLAEIQARISDAQAAAITAGASKDAAHASEVAAQAAQAAVSTLAQTATDSLAQANAAVTTAQNLSNSLSTALTTATQKASDASASAAAAAASATSASTSATNAGTSATNASNSATSASTSATTATNQATTATTKAGNAATSATNAATSESNALGYKNAANTSATNAAGSATTAGNSATAAATSATNAGNSATAAAQSATDAATSKTNAANSATAAAGSATNAANSATAAAQSATQASQAAASSVPSFNTRTGPITLTSADVTTALTFTPYNATNPLGFITSAGNAATATKLGTARTINGVAFDGSANITVVDSTAMPLAGLAVFTGSPTLANNVYLGAKDTAGTVTRVLGISSSGNTFYVGGIDTSLNTALVLRAGGVDKLNVSGANIYPPTTNATWLGTTSNRWAGVYSQAGDFATTLNVAGAATFSSTLTVGGSAVWTAASLTNLSQLTNGPGFITASASITGNAATATRAAGLSVYAGNETILHDGIASGSTAWINYRGSSGSGIPQYNLGNGLANSGLSQLNVSALTTKLNGENLRMWGDNAYISGWNMANSTRSGYLQFNAGSNVILQAETGPLILGGNGQYAFSTDGTNVYPQANNSKGLGTAALRWSALYGMAADFGGQVAAPKLFINKQGNTASGIMWYANSGTGGNSMWIDYMANAGTTGNGPWATSRLLQAPSSPPGRNARPSRTSLATAGRGSRRRAPRPRRSRSQNCGRPMVACCSRVA